MPHLHGREHRHLLRWLEELGELLGMDHLLMNFDLGQSILISGPAKMVFNIIYTSQSAFRWVVVSSSRALYLRRSPKDLGNRICRFESQYNAEKCHVQA